MSLFFLLSQTPCSVSSQKAGKVQTLPQNAHHTRVLPSAHNVALSHMQLFNKGFWVQS